MPNEKVQVAFSALPLQKDGPPGNAWGLFGKDDELGMLNLLTAETTCQAVKEIIDGTRVSIDLPLNKFNVPAFGRQAFHQHIHHKAPRTVNDDILTFNTQSSTQWDGFRHFGILCFERSKMWVVLMWGQGIKSTSSISMDAGRKILVALFKMAFMVGSRPPKYVKLTRVTVWVRNGGVTGRGVLLDYQSWAESEGLVMRATSTTSITLDELQKVVASQNVELRRGDILCVRSGYLKAFDALSDEEARALVTHPAPPAIGLQSSEDVLQWIWETGFAAVAGDMPSFEAWPCQNTRFFLHEWLLAGWGMPIGELFDFERLAIECKKRKKWTFFFNSMPLNVSYQASSLLGLLLTYGLRFLGG